MKYSNEFETYDIIKFTINGQVRWFISQDGVFATKSYTRLKDAKKAIDNQEVYF